VLAGWLYGPTTLLTSNAVLRTPGTVDQDSAEWLLEELEKAKWKFPPNRIFNFDETHRKCCLGPPKVFAEKGSEAVKLKTGKGEKESYTGYDCLSAAGEKLRFWIITKGKPSYLTPNLTLHLM
jgi:hypothetical protein